MVYTKDYMWEQKIEVTVIKLRVLGMKSQWTIKSEYIEWIYKRISELIEWSLQFPLVIERIPYWNVCLLENKLNEISSYAKEGLLYKNFNSQRCCIEV